MSELQIVRIDGIKWWITGNPRDPVPLCPDHDLRMVPDPPLIRKTGSSGWHKDYPSNATKLICAENSHRFELPRKYSEEKIYVINRVDAKVFKGAKVLNLDDEAVPIAKEKSVSKDGKYFITSQLMESKRGLQAVIYAGEKGKAQKTQIFVEPNVKKMSFDHRDLLPSEVFLEIKATFNDGTSNTISK